MNARTRPSLSIFLIAFVGLTAVISGLVLLWQGDRKLATFERAALDQIAVHRAEAVAGLFARELWSVWHDVAYLAQSVDPTDLSDARSKLTFIVGDGTRVSWAGMTRLDGTIIASSGAILEGRSVAERPWFERGLQGAFAGDVRNAKLLADLLPRIGDEPLRFLDLAAPIIDPRGDAIGVVGFHISHAWSIAYLAEITKDLGIEAVIVDRSGKVVIGPDKLMGVTLAMESVGAARTGRGTAVEETWPDGRSGLSVVIPTVSHGDLPSFGWSLVARLDRGELARSRGQVALDLFWLMLALAVAVLCATLLFARFFFHPIDRIAESAEKIARGEDAYPEESRRSREGARLSAAIAAIQERLERH